jgi:hypothetical protein
VSVFFFANKVSAVGFCRTTEIGVWLQLNCLGLTMDASRSVPGVVALHIFDAVNEVWASWDLTLAKVLGLTKLVRSNGFEVLYGLLNHHSFRELFFISFIFKSESCSVEYFLFSVPKPMVGGIKLPVVVSVLLLSGCEVSVGLSIHIAHLGIFLGGSVSGVEHVLGIFKSLTGDSELHASIFSLGGPLVTSAVSVPEGFFDVRSILVFFDVVELVLHAGQGLGFDHF